MFEHDGGSVYHQGIFMNAANLARRGRAGFGGGGAGLQVDPTFAVAGCGMSQLNGQYRQDGTNASKPTYKQVGGTGLIYFNGFWKLNHLSSVGGW